MTSNILNPAAILGGFKTATAAATTMANKKISDTTGAALNSAEEIGGGSSSTEGGLEIPPISAKISDIPANISDIQTPDMSSIQTPDISSIQSDALNNVKNTMGSTNQDLLNTSFGNTKGQFDPVKIKSLNTRGSRPSRNKGIISYGGGRKTKNNRKKTVQPKVKKPRTKKCLITKGDKMFMSFCI
jgi:hypothetical protein